MNTFDKETRILVAAELKRLRDLLAERFGFCETGPVWFEANGDYRTSVWIDANHTSVIAETEEELFSKVGAMLDKKSIAAFKREQAAKLLAEAEQIEAAK